MRSIVPSAECRRSNQALDIADGRLLDVDVGQVECLGDPKARGFRGDEAGVAAVVEFEYVGGRCAVGRAAPAVVGPDE